MMVFLAHLLPTLGLLGLARVSNAYDYSPSPSCGPKDTAKAVYFISNNADNAVVALKVNAQDGKLSQGSVTPTGGRGGNQINAMTGMPAGPDALGSQSALTVAGNMLVAVNAGSNTLSLFKIDEQEPTKLMRVGEPVDTMGEFPVSVAASTVLNQACVANTGARAGIACFRMSASSGLTPLDNSTSTPRPFSLNQSTPPLGPLNGVAQVFFNADSTALLTTVKGNPMQNNTGFLSIYPVVNNLVSSSPSDEVRSSPNGTAVLFGSTVIPRDPKKIVVTDATFGAAVLRINDDLTATSIVNTPIPNQRATCWAIYSEYSREVYVTDPTANKLVGISPMDGSITTDVRGAEGNIGYTDLTAQGKFVYALSPAVEANSTMTGITVWELTEEGKEEKETDMEMEGGGRGGGGRGDMGGKKKGNGKYGYGRYHGYVKRDANAQMEKSEEMMGKDMGMEKMNIKVIQNFNPGMEFGRNSMGMVYF